MFAHSTAPGARAVPRPTMRSPAVPSRQPPPRTSSAPRARLTSLRRRATETVTRASAPGDDDAEGDADAGDDASTMISDEAIERARTELLIDTSSNPLRELFSVESLEEARASGTRLERVVGAENVPQAIIEAERNARPLRRPRLVVYALSASAAAAQAVSIALEPGSFESPGASALSDACVIIIGSILWRVELQQRADNLRLIWAKAKEREASLTRAEAGMGDTIWTARMRKKNDKMKKSEAASEDEEEQEEGDDADSGNEQPTSD